MEWWQKLFDTNIICEILYSPKRLDNTSKECDFIESVLKLSRKEKILDLACGTGRHTIELAKRGYVVTGFDYSKQCLDKARNFAKKAKVEAKFIRGDMRELSFDNEFDAIISMFTSFGYFKNEKDHLKVLNCVAKNLRVGGKFLLDTVSGEWLIRHFRAKDWEEFSNFKLLEERKLDLEHSRINTKWIVVQGAKTKEYFHSLRFFTLSELITLLNQAILKPVAYYGGYDKKPFDLDTNRLIIVSKRG